MSRHSPMEDFVADLERRLTGAAVLPAAASTSARWGLGRTCVTRRVVALGLSAAVLAVAIVGVAGSSGQTSPAAYAQWKILQTRPVDARFDAARPIPSKFGTIYFVASDRGWCMVAPDPLTMFPDVGVSCVPGDRFANEGLILGLGASFYAVLPDGMRLPTLRAPDGEERTIQPNEQGVVIAEDLPKGSVVTTFDRDGVPTRRAIPLGFELQADLAKQNLRDRIEANKRARSEARDGGGG